MAVRCCCHGRKQRAERKGGQAASDCDCDSDSERVEREEYRAILPGEIKKNNKKRVRLPSLETRERKKLVGKARQRKKANAHMISPVHSDLFLLSSLGDWIASIYYYFPFFCFVFESLPYWILCLDKSDIRELAEQSSFSISCSDSQSTSELFALGILESSGVLYALVWWRRDF